MTHDCLMLEPKSLLSEEKTFYCAPLFAPPVDVKALRCLARPVPADMSVRCARPKWSWELGRVW